MNVVNRMLSREQWIRWAKFGGGFLTAAAALVTILTFAFTYTDWFNWLVRDGSEPKPTPHASKGRNAVFTSDDFRLRAVAFHHVVRSGAANGRFLFRSRSVAPLRIAIKSIDPREFATNRAFVELIAANAQKCWVTNKEITGFSVATKESIVNDKSRPALRKNEERLFSIAFRCSAGKSLPAPVIHITFLVLDPAKGDLREIATTVRTPERTERAR